MRCYSLLQNIRERVKRSNVHQTVQKNSLNVINKFTLEKRQSAIGVVLLAAPRTKIIKYVPMLNTFWAIVKIWWYRLLPDSDFFLCLKNSLWYSIVYYNCIGMLVFSPLTNIIGAQHCSLSGSHLPLSFHEKLSHFLVDIGVFLSHIFTIAKHIIYIYKQICQNPQNDFYGPGSEYIFLWLRTRYCQGGTVVPN